MTYYERLSLGSTYHRALKKGVVLFIVPMDMSVDKLRGFQDIVEQAKFDPDNEGLRVQSHYNSRLSLPGDARKVCDHALVFKQST